MSKEVWKVIPGYNVYSVSNFGNVKTNNFNHEGYSKMLKTFENASGYMACNLVEKNIPRKRKLVHRLVAMCFVPNPDNKPCINHKDGNKLNNHFENLEWCTAIENTKHAHRTGLVGKTTSGEDHYRSTLSTIDVKNIRKLIKSKVTGRTIAKVFGVSEKYISAIKTGRSRKHETI